MAVTVTSNKLNRAATVHVSAANASIVVAGNSSTSNIATGNEELTGGYIKQIFYGSDATGYINISRGGDLLLTLQNSGHMDFAAKGLALTINESANVDVEFVGTANGFVMMEIHKTGSFQPY